MNIKNLLWKRIRAWKCTKHAINDDKLYINWINNVFFTFLNYVCFLHSITHNKNKGTKLTESVNSNGQDLEKDDDIQLEAVVLYESYQFVGEIVFLALRIQ